MQSEVLLFVTAAYKKISHKQLLKEVGLPLLEKRRKSQKIQFIYKAKHGLLPNYLSEKIPSSVGLLNNYYLQNSDDIQVPKSKKNNLKKSYIPSSIKSWNKSPVDVKEQYL